jgi:GLPGLI family protein
MIKVATGCLIGLLFFSGCEKSNQKTRINNGRVEYKITYETDSTHKKIVDLLPRRMKLVFNDDSAINIMEGFMGMYKLNSITYFRSRKCSTLLKVPKYSFLYEGKKGEPMCCFNDMDNMIIHRTGETKNILGFTCHKAEISFTDSDDKFSIYYTHDIGIRNPNSTNPYKKIDGVLMEFELSMYFLKMRFTADKFVPLTKTDNYFNIPRNYHELTRDQMCQLLGRYLE